MRRPKKDATALSESAVVGFDHVVPLPVSDVSSRWHEFVEHAWIDRRPVGLNLLGSRPHRSARVKKWRASAASRRVETSTSITWPCWSTAR
jgi:hypothetical protein